MNFFYKIYSTDTCIENARSKDWEKFGKEQLKKLLLFLGSDENFADELVNGDYKYVEFPRGTKLLHPGEVCDHIYFVISGSCKHYRFENDEIQIVELENEGSLSASVEGMMKNQATDFFIETREKCRMLKYSKEYIFSMMENYEEQFNTVSVSIMNIALEFQKKLNNILHLEGKERLELFQKEFPGMNESFTGKEIASFLGMKPETFSRLKSKISIEE